jgi:mRNA interferase HigB
MRVISRKPLKNFAEEHSKAKSPLDAWYREVKEAEWKNFADIRAHFGSADVVAGNRVIFDIGGNKYRLVVKVAYQIGVLYVKFIGTHKEYDKVDAERVELK